MGTSWLVLLHLRSLECTYVTNVVHLHWTFLQYKKNYYYCPPGLMASVTVLNSALPLHHDRTDVCVAKNMSKADFLIPPVLAQMKGKVLR